MDEDARKKGEHLPQGNLTYRIIGAAMEVHRELGPGFLEAVYHEALEKEFGIQGIAFRKEASLGTFYKGEPLKKRYKVDFVVESAVLVELKAVAGLGTIEEAQMVNYLRMSKTFQVGLVINFGSESLEWKRLVL